MESVMRKTVFETFNTFNHAQFDGATSVDGNRDDATFGQILKSQPGRVSQVALKFQFQFLHVNPGWGFAEQGKAVAVIRNFFSLYQASCWTGVMPAAETRPRNGIKHSLQTEFSMVNSGTAGPRFRVVHLIVMLDRQDFSG
jgi:hypothetical protein